MALYPNKSPAQTFGGILNTESNSQLTNILQVVQDGMGGNSPLSLSLLSIDINTTMGTFTINGDALTATPTQINNVCENASFSNFTTAINVPHGTTEQRPVAPQNGDFRYNTDTNSFEGFQNGAWVTFTTL